VKATFSTDCFSFVCPACGELLSQVSAELMVCKNEGRKYPLQDGIWRFLTTERLTYFQQFIQEYETVRRLEGRGSDDPQFYRSLPEKDLTGRFVEGWKIRARSYQALIHQLQLPDGTDHRSPLKILDLGAGNGWLSYRLTRYGCQVAAVDLHTDEFDGLGAARHYDRSFTCVQAEFDRLPFINDQADLVIFNASLHYSLDFCHTLREALRVLKNDGKAIVLDSPIYRDSSSGQQMVIEREKAFTRQFGFPSNSLPFENYLTYQRLEELAASLQIKWSVIKPFYNLSWSLRPWMARLRNRREPATFALLIAERVQ
jgi:ubiquinone/menaquinone biosynthesis C-methylase UbiE